MFEGYADVLTVEETTEALRMGYNAVYKLLRTGELKGLRNGRVWMVPKIAIQEYILTRAKIKT